MVEENQLYNLVAEMNLNLKENTKILNQMSSSLNYVRSFDSPLRNYPSNQISNIQNFDQVIRIIYSLINIKN